MPELPEVESLRRYLVREGVVGRVIERVDVESNQSPEKGTGAISGIDNIRGRTIRSLERRGKQIAVVLDEGVLGLHMGMTGRIDVLSPDEAVPRFTRVEFLLVNGDDRLRVVLADPRRWGMVQHFESLDEIFAGMGPDALDPDLTAEWFSEAVSERKSPIKPLLLNQSLIAGVGNIYADEACWIAGIDPRASAQLLGPKRVARLHTAIMRTLNDALNDRGSTFSDYRDGAGQSGLHQVRWHVFRRDGEPCERCGREIRKTRVAGRGTHFCPGCQRR